MRVLIVAPNVSARMGGEAILPYHYIRELPSMGVEVHALSHARIRDEMMASPLAQQAKFHFIEDSPLERTLHRIGKKTPAALRETVFGTAVTTSTFARLAGRARRLEKEIRFDIIHQPTPVSPQFPSFLSNMATPVIIGPMNGGMTYPQAFEKDYAQGTGAGVAVARAISGLANRAAPGKRTAARVLVANERTRAVLPPGIDPSKVELLVENGVDLDLWSPPPADKPTEPVFVFVGRMVRLKALDLLIEAFGRLEIPARLLIIGDGAERAKLELQAQALAGAHIEFLGFKQQPEIRDILAASTALILPSMRECGGAVVLEAFACRTPAIATDWGGPQDYITPETGFLIAPSGREAFISELTAAMLRLANDPALAARLGEAARRRVESHYAWRAKAAQMKEIYWDVAREAANNGL